MDVSHEPVFQQTTLQVVFEFPADELWQAAAGFFDRLNEARVVFGDNGIERRLLRPVTAVGRSEGNRGRSEHQARTG